MTIIAKNDTFQIDEITMGPYGNNTYIVVCLKTRASALVDAPADAETILEHLQGTEPRYILLTHNHSDHTGALAELYDRLSVPLAAHASDWRYLPIKPDKQLRDGDVLEIGDVKLDVIHTPGHTPGSVCFKLGRYLLSGDTLFSGGPGRTTRPAAFKQILESITEKIMILPDDTLVYPGHGDATVLKKEREEFAVFSSRPHDPELSGDIVWLTS
jgi:glyoxylase-like metal-dependent hydrolase (beta-lactamase superfamily II)